MTNTLAGILVTDLVGSTSLRSRLGDQRGELLRRDHERLLRAIVQRHCGLVVSWLGDGILAAFPSASAAARAAVGIQQALERENRRPRRVAEMIVRIGVGAGDVVWTERGCEGRPEREAAVLCRACPGGEILISDDALELIGSRESLRTLESGPGVHKIEWQPIRSAVVRTVDPPEPRVVGGLPFVGREGVLSRLREVIRRSIAGEPQLVSIEGEAGIGKSRLCGELAQAAALQGVVVMNGTSHDGLAIPYEPIAGALRSWVESIDDLSIRLGARAGELARLVPELAEMAPDLPPPTESNAETEQVYLYDAVAEWLSTAAMDDPVLLVLDSIHCAANPTFDLIRHSLRLLKDHCITIVATHRPGDARPSALAEWAREAFGPDSVTVIRLSGLQPGEVVQLLDVRGADGRSQELAGAIHLATGGNPLHIGALLRSDASDLGERNLPSTVEAALRSNLDRLDEFARRSLEAAAVLGEEFEGALLARLAGDPDRTYDALELAGRMGLVREVDRRAVLYAFSHSLIHQILYESIGAGRLARLHERAALLLEGIPGPQSDRRISELSRHFGSATALGYAGRAAHYVAQAATRALDQYANEQAADLFEKALQHLEEAEDPGLWCDLMIGRGEALRRMGDPGHRSLLFTVADRALALGEGGRAGRALLATYRGTFSHALQVDQDQVRRLRSILDRIGESDGALRARLTARLAVELTWADDRSESQRLSDEAVAVARAVGDRTLIAEVLARRQWTVFHPIDDRLKTTDELGELAREVSDPMLRFDVSGTDVFTAIRTGNRAELERAISMHRLLAAEIGQQSTRWMLLINEATLALLEGRFEDMKLAIEEGREIGRRIGQPDVDAQYAGHRFWLDFETMPIERARDGIERIVRNFDRLPWYHRTAVLFRCCDLEMDDLVRALVEPILPASTGELIDQLSLPRACQFATIATRLGDAAAADRLMDVLLPHAAEHGSMLFGTVGSVSRYVGLLSRALGRLDDAEHWLRAAEDSNAKLGAVSWLARTRLDLAELRFARAGRGDPAGQEWVARSRAAAEELGLPTVLARADRLMRS